MAIIYKTGIMPIPRLPPPVAQWQECGFAARQAASADTARPRSRKRAARSRGTCAPPRRPDAGSTHSRQLVRRGPPAGGTNSSLTTRTARRRRPPLRSRCCSPIRKIAGSACAGTSRTRKAASFRAGARIDGAAGCAAHAAVGRALCRQLRARLATHEPQRKSICCCAARSLKRDPASASSGWRLICRSRSPVSMRTLPSPSVAMVSSMSNLRMRRALDRGNRWTADSPSSR